MSRFDGKRGLVTGVANKRSIAWAIGRRLADEGAQLAFTFQGERIEKNVRDLAETVSAPLVTPCDVRSDEDLERLKESYEARGQTLPLAPGTYEEIRLLASAHHGSPNSTATLNYTDGSTQQVRPLLAQWMRGMRFFRRGRRRWRRAAIGRRFPRTSRCW